MPEEQLAKLIDDTGELLRSPQYTNLTNILDSVILHTANRSTLHTLSSAITNTDEKLLRELQCHEVIRGLALIKNVIGTIEEIANDKLAANQE